MTKYRIPVRCNFQGQPRLSNEPDGGYTVVEVTGETNARDFMWRYAHAAMPCWKRPLTAFEHKVQS